MFMKQHSDWAGNVGRYSTERKLLDSAITPRKCPPIIAVNCRDACAEIAELLASGTRSWYNFVLDHNTPYIIVYSRKLLFSIGRPMLVFYS